MTIDLDKLEALAKAAGAGQWTASDGVVWFDDGDSAMQVMNPVPAFIAHDNLGTWPDAIAAEDVAAFAAAVSPASVLALIAEVRALRETIKRQASAARAGMEAAKAGGAIMLQEAVKARAESSPEALASERAMNAMLTEENEALREDAERYRWLRDKANSMGHVKRAPMVLMTRDDCSNNGWEDVLIGEGLDVAIDAARGAK